MPIPLTTVHHEQKNQMRKTVISTHIYIDNIYSRNLNSRLTNIKAEVCALLLRYANYSLFWIKIKFLAKTSN